MRDTLRLLKMASMVKRAQAWKKVYDNPAARHAVEKWLEYDMGLGPNYVGGNFGMSDKYKAQNPNAIPDDIDLVEAVAESMQALGPGASAVDLAGHALDSRSRDLAIRHILEGTVTSPEVPKRTRWDRVKDTLRRGKDKVVDAGRSAWGYAKEHPVRTGVSAAAILAILSGLGYAGHSAFSDRKRKPAPQKRKSTAKRKTTSKSKALKPKTAALRRLARQIRRGY